MTSDMRAALRRIRPFAAFVAALLACTPTASSPVVDSGDGSALSSCQRECAARADAGCLEAQFASSCVVVCEHGLDAGVYQACATCAHYVGPDGLAHVRCNP